MSTLSEKIAIMQAFERGEKIEWIHKNDDSDEWESNIAPLWNWEEIEYRIANPAPKSGTLVTMLDVDGEIRFTLKDGPQHNRLINYGWTHILELDKEITLP